MKRRGLRTRPWGTPEETGEGCEEKDLIVSEIEVKPEEGRVADAMEESLLRSLGSEIASESCTQTRRIRMESKPEQASIRR